MKPLIATDYEIRRFHREALSWVGTPFAIRSAVKGAGVDCVRFCAQVLTNVGHGCDYSNLPHYVSRSGHALVESRLIGWIENEGREWFQPVGAVNDIEFLQRISSMRLAPGDVLTIRIGAVAHHAGIVFKDLRFLHAMEGGKVEFADLRDPTYGQRLVAAFRPIRKD